MSKSIADQPVVYFGTRAEWDGWLEENHGKSDGVWLKIARKGAAAESISREDALRSALCYGWIDSQAASFDDTFWLQRFTPRRATSRWSKRNRELVGALIASGEMRPPGLAEVDRAKKDGRWEDAYDSPSTASVPADLQRELDRHPKAAAFFATLDGRNRFAILHRIQTAKRPETRARRIAKFVAMLNAHETIY